MTKVRPNDWLLFIREDLAVTNAAFEEGAYNLVCFHAQQAAEKLLKAVLVFYDQPVPRVHLLRELYKLVITRLPKLKDYLDILEAFDRYYIPTRYPEALPGSLPEGLPTKKDAEEALADVNKFYKFIISVIGKENAK